MTFLVCCYFHILYNKSRRRLRLLRQVLQGRHNLHQSVACLTLLFHVVRTQLRVNVGVGRPESQVAMRNHVRRCLLLVFEFLNCFLPVEKTLRNECVLGTARHAGQVKTCCFITCKTEHSAKVSVEVKPRVAFKPRALERQCSLSEALHWYAADVPWLVRHRRQDGQRCLWCAVSPCFLSNSFIGNFDVPYLQQSLRLASYSSTESSNIHRRGQRAEGRGQRAEGRGQRAEGRGQMYLSDYNIPTQKV